MAQSTRETRVVAELVEGNKKAKYYSLARAHHFVPVAVETSGAFGPAALELLTDIAKCIQTITQEVKSRAYLFQRISVALQQGNAPQFWDISGVYHRLISLCVCVCVCVCVFLVL